MKANGFYWLYVNTGNAHYDKGDWWELAFISPAGVLWEKALGNALERFGLDNVTYRFHFVEQRRKVVVPDGDS